MRVLISGVSAVAIQAAGAALAFLVQLVLARLLGAEAFGVFAFYFSLAMIFGTWGRLGSDMAVMRIGGEVSVSNSPQLSHVLTHGQQVALVGGLAGSLLLAGTMLAVGVPNSHQVVLAIGALLILPVSINGVRQAALLALGRTSVALLPEMLLRPTLVLLMLTLMFAMGVGFALEASIAMALMAVSAVLSTLVLGHLVNQLIPKSEAAPIERAETARWTRLGISLMFVNASYLLVYHSDIILLGFKLAPESIGPYQIAKQVSQLGLFAMIAVQLVFGPRMAALVAGRQWHELKRLIQATVWLGAGFAGAMLVAFAVTGEWIMALFGPQFADAYELSLVLLAAQLGVAFIGPVGVLASMSGHQNLAAATYLVGALLMFTVGPILIGSWGLMGAAIAQGVVAFLSAAIVGVGIACRIPIYGPVQTID